jgi:hypothetical protein
LKIMAQNLNPSLTNAFAANDFDADYRITGTLPRLARFLEGGRPEAGPSEASTAGSYVMALDALDREITRIRLQSRHWLM